MRSSRLLLTTLVATTLLASLAAPALADGEKDRAGKDDAREKGLREKDDDDGPRFGFHHFPHGPQWVLRNDNITVWFHEGGHGKAKPDLRVFQTGENGTKVGYSIAIRSIVEVGPGKDVNESRRYREMKLAGMDDWNVKTEESNASLTLTMVHAEAQGIVTLVFHVSKTAPSVKFDVDVDNWQWAANATDHHLALVLITHERQLVQDREDGPRSAHVDGGFITWAPTATVHYGAVSRVVNVTAEKGQEGKDGRLVLAFNAPGGYTSLAYDPELGLSTASASATARGLPALPVAGALAGVAIAAVAFGRRRE